MLIERIEARWIDAFEKTLRLCALAAGDSVAILSETQSRRVLVDLAELACARLGSRAFHIVVPSPAVSSSVPIRSTGASNALGGLAPVVRALSAADLIVDCTVEGLLHSRELAQILEGSEGRRPRLLMVSNEHPEILERTTPDAALEPVVRAAMQKLRKAQWLEVSSAQGTNLKVNLKGARIGGVWGYCAKPGQVAHWPGGLCLAFPAQGSVNGQLVLAPGDINLTFKRYLRERIALTIRDDFVTAVEGTGLDAELMQSYWDAFGDRLAYGVSHVGWGLNPHARWDALAFYDKRDCNGTELRAFAGNFLYSTGANEVAGRHTLGHFDLPLRHCTVRLDGQAVVEAGQVVDAKELV
ncbi:MAG: peptidase M29 [Burkholderiaceae bacterium]